MLVFRVRISAMPRALYVLARGLEDAVAKGIKAAKRAGVREVDVSSVRKLGKAVR